MKITKIKSKALITHKDIIYNQRIGLPVEVFSIQSQETLAFGKIQLCSDQFICVSDQFFSREHHMFFGCPYQST